MADAGSGWFVGLLLFMTIWFLGGFRTKIFVSGHPTRSLLWKGDWLEEIPLNKLVSIQLHWIEAEKDSKVAFTGKPVEVGQPCPTRDLLSEIFPVKKNGDAAGDGSGAAYVDVKFGPFHPSLLYACVQDRHQQEWTHTGLKLKIQPEPSKRVVLPAPDSITSVIGLRAENDRSYINEDGVVVIPARQFINVRLYGSNFTNTTDIMFTTVIKNKDQYCEGSSQTQVVTVHEVRSAGLLSNSVVLLSVQLPETDDGINEYYFCIKHSITGHGRVWIHQGSDSWLRIKVEGKMFPLWLQVVFIIVLLTLSGLFSGLNLGLMALDRTELQVIAKCGSEHEKKYAQLISPLRTRGNYLLCSLLLGNVLVNTTLTILLDDLTSGLVAVLGATIGIVLFGEIIPQAICSRHGLAIGAKTVVITKFFMIVTFPVSYPISKILDWCLGEEIGNVYDRERLMEYIRLTKDYNKLENEEVNIISGALELKKKTVSDVMTKIEDVFMISYDANLNFETVSEIMKRGYTRVPVFDDDRNNVVAILNIKDLAFVDPDDNTPLRTLCEFYNHPIHFVFEDETLDVMLNEFKKGQSHMAFVRHIHTEDDTDPFYEIIGVVTLEDVIEELIQSEIIDESDILTDNRRKQRRSETQIKQDFSDFAKIGVGLQGKNIISPQLALATFQYLSTSVEPFKKQFVSVAVLRRLMTQNIFFSLKFVSKDSSNAPAMTLYQTGRPADYFVLIIEGRVRVTVGRENLVFEAGPFTFFGGPAIALASTPVESSNQNLHRSSSFSLCPLSDLNSSKSSFIPDYTAVIVADTVFMKVHRAVYLAAHRATLMEQQQRNDPSCTEEQFRTEWENVVTAVNATDSRKEPSFGFSVVGGSVLSVVTTPPQPTIAPSSSVSSNSLLMSPGNHRHLSLDQTGTAKHVSIEIGGITLPKTDDKSPNPKTDDKYPNPKTDDKKYSNLVSGVLRRVSSPSAKYEGSETFKDFDPGRVFTGKQARKEKSRKTSKSLQSGEPSSRTTSNDGCSELNSGGSATSVNTEEMDSRKSCNVTPREFKSLEDVQGIMEMREIRDPATVALVNPDSSRKRNNSSKANQNSEKSQLLS